MNPQTSRRLSTTVAIFIVGTFIGAGSLLLMMVKWSHSPGFTTLNTVPRATSELPVPIIETVKATEEGKKRVDEAEEAMLQKLEKVSADSPERFGLYGSFAQQAESEGMYDVAEVYYKKAFVLGPAVYKTYFANKSAADFQMNWSSMYVNMNHFTEAASVAEKVYNQEVKVLGAESEHAISAGTTYASNLGYAKQYKEKQLLSEKLITLLEKTGNTKSGEYVTALRCLAESYQGQNKLPEAKRWYLKSLAVSSANPEMHLYTEDLEQTLAGFKTIEESAATTAESTTKPK